MVTSALEEETSQQVNQKELARPFFLENNNNHFSLIVNEKSVSQETFDRVIADKAKYEEVIALLNKCIETKGTAEKAMEHVCGLLYKEMEEACNIAHDPARASEKTVNSERVFEEKNNLLMIAQSISELYVGEKNK